MECSFNGCGRKVFCKGFCNTHYKQDLQGLPLTPIREKVEGAGQGECSADGCTNRATAKYLCRSHLRHISNGHEVRPLQKHAPRGLGHINSNGYREISVDGVRYLEHRYVMEQVLGRALLPFENVHHINGVRNDNRPENLELWITKQPKGQRPEDLVDWAREVLNLYG